MAPLQMLPMSPLLDYQLFSEAENQRDLDLATSHCNPLSDFIMFWKQEETVPTFTIKRVL